MRKLCVVLGLMVVALMASAPKASANCYLNGWIWIDQGFYTGSERPTVVAWGEVANYQDEAWAEIGCDVVLVHTEAWWPYWSNSISCNNGSMVGAKCMGDGPTSGFEIEQEDYAQAGHFGVWEIKGEFGHWSTGPTWGGNHFIITEYPDFGWPEPPNNESECNIYYPHYEWYPLDNQCRVPNSPILVPTTRSQQMKLTDKAHGVAFDFDCDGVLEATAWTEAGSDLAFLAYDADGDGQITCGKELMGNLTVPGKPNGFAALQVLGGGLSMTADNPFFSKLLLWTDRNHNGVSEKDELVPFGDQFAQVSLGATRENRKDGSGNRFLYRGYVVEKSAKPVKDFTQDDFRLHNRFVYDVFFGNK